MLILNLFQKELGIVIKIIVLNVLKNIKIIFPAVLLTELFVYIGDKFSKPVVFFTEEKMQLINLLKQLLKSMIIAKKQ